MIIGRDYMLRKPQGPSAPKVFFDTRVIPLAVNAVGALEVALDRAARRGGVRPSILLAGIAGVASLLLIGLRRPTRAGTDAA